MANNMISKVAALASGTSVFLGGMATLPTSFPVDLLISTPLAGVVGMATWYFWPGRVRRETRREIADLLDDAERLNAATGISNRELVETINLVTGKLDRILRETAKIKSPNTTRKIKHLDVVGRKIIDDFRQDPSDIKRAQAWIHSYLDQTLDCVKQYGQLSRTGARSIEAQKQMAEFDDLLDLLLAKSQELLDHLLTNDTTNFQVNTGVLRDMLKTEGMK